MTFFIFILTFLKNIVTFFYTFFLIVTEARGGEQRSGGSGRKVEGKVEGCEADVSRMMFFFFNYRNRGRVTKRPRMERSADKTKENERERMGGREENGENDEKRRERGRGKEDGKKMRKGQLFG